MPNYSILGGNRGVNELFQRPEVADVSRKPKALLDNASTVAERKSVTVSLKGSEQIQNLAIEYDVRNLTPRDMSELSQQLFDQGLIEFDEHALLSFQPEMNFDTQQVTQGNPDQPKDFIAQWQEQKRLHLDQGNHGFAQKDQKILNVLMNIESLGAQSLAQAETGEFKAEG